MADFLTFSYHLNALTYQIFNLEAITKIVIKMHIDKGKKWYHWKTEITLFCNNALEPILCD